MVGGRGISRQELVTDLTEVTVTASDSIRISDADDSGTTRRDTVQGILDLAGSMDGVVDDTTPQLGGDLDCNGAQVQWSKGADVASAPALPVLTDGNYFDVTGTTGITSINTTGGAGTLIKLHFDGVLTLTHHATDLYLAGEANFTTAAGDELEFIEYATGDYRMTGCSLAGTAPGAVANNAIDETKLKDALVADFSEVTVAAGDSILLGDADDSGNTKRDTVQGILDLASSGTVTSVATGTGLTGGTITGSGTVSVATGGIDTTQMADNAIDETKLKDALVADFSEVTVVAGDSILLGDADDSGNTKRDTVQGILDLADSPIGQHTIWFPASAMEAAASTAPATSNAVEIGTSLFAARTMDFATDADDYAYFGVQMPKSWDAGTLVCQFVWSATGTTANTVLWGLAANSLGDDAVLTEAFPTPTTQIDTNSTTADDLMVSPEVSVTVGSTPTAEDYVAFEVMRDVSGDNLAEDARLHGIKIHYTTDAGSDT